jgi:hypothetical protein
VECNRVYIKSSLGSWSELEQARTQNKLNYYFIRKKCWSHRVNGCDYQRLYQQSNNTICVGQHYAQANTNNVNKTWALPQTTGGKDEPNNVNKTWALPQITGGKDEPTIVFMRKS